MEKEGGGFGGGGESEKGLEKGKTHTSGKGEFQVVGAEGVVVYGGVDDFVQELGFAE